jgi:hypothetical protein
VAPEANETPPPRRGRENRKNIRWAAKGVGPRRRPWERGSGSLGFVSGRYNGDGPEMRSLGDRTMDSSGDGMGEGTRHALLGSVTGGASDEAGRRPYTWRPGPEVEANLPPGFHLELIALSGPGAMRRFVPAQGLESFLLKASLGGLALLGQLRALDPGERFSYDAMRLVFQQAPRLREHLARSFRREVDLRVAGSEIEILPDRIGLDARGQGRRWTVAELIRQGRGQKSPGGQTDLSPEEAIAGGLLAAARLDPIDPASLSEAEGRALVRLALFDLGPGDGPLAPEVKTTVTDRFLRLLEGHIGDDTAAFDGWFFEARADLIRCIAGQRKEGGPIDREAVREALLELVWDSFTYVGDCVALQMDAFDRALPEPLVEEERRAFDAFYARQAYLGGLPLVMLRERFDFLHGALLDLLDDPADPGRIGVLLRLLEYYSTMVARRREADRAAKRRGPGASRGSSGTARGKSPAGSLEDNQVPSLFRSIAEELRKAGGITCRCGIRGVWSTRQFEGDESAEPIVLLFDCASCGRSEQLEVGRAEFAEIGKRLLHTNEEA